MIYMYNLMLYIRTKILSMYMSTFSLYKCQCYHVGIPTRNSVHVTCMLLGSCMHVKLNTHVTFMQHACYMHVAHWVGQHACYNHVDMLQSCQHACYLMHKLGICYMHVACMLHEFYLIIKLGMYYMHVACM